MPGEQRIRPFVAVLAIAVMLATVGCSSSSSSSSSSDGTQPPGTRPSNVVAPEGEPTDGGSVVVGVTSETDNWNPAFAQWADAGNLVASSVYEPLYVYDKDGNTVPWLAVGAKANADFTEWTIEVRKGITFHDGTPMNAASFVTSVTAGAKDGLSSLVLKALVGEIRAIDEHTFVVTTTQPWPAFLNNLTTQIGIAAAPAMYVPEDKMKDHPVGTGAYRFESWTPDKAFVTARNDAYWGGPCAAPSPSEPVVKLCADMGVPLGRRNGPFLDSIEFRPLTDDDLRFSALKSGDIDLMFTTSPRNVPAGSTDLQVISDKESEKTFLQLNTKAPPLDNPHARKALAYAAVPDDVISVVSPDLALTRDTSPYGSRGKWGLPPDQTGYVTPDLEKAKAEVEAYKKDTGKDALSFTMAAVANADDQAVLQLLQQQFESAGIQTTIETVEQVSLITTLVGGRFESMLVRNYAYPEPDSMNVFFSEVSAKGPLFVNFSQYATPEIDEALVAARATADVSARKAEYDKVARLRNDAVTEVWLFDTPYTILAKPEVHGLNPFRVIPWGNFVPKPFVTGIWKDRAGGGA